MIWSGGAILDEEELSIGPSDRTFEHGLGLFETMRTWSGRPAFLEDHRARMLTSAQALHIPIEPGQFPGKADVARLLKAEGHTEDRLLRVTATGGDRRGSVVWLRSSALPAPRGSIRVELGTWTIQPGDPLARHKTLNYWFRRIARQDASGRGFDETLGSSDGGGFCEGAASNLFVIRRGELLTPSLQAPILPGVMRRFVLGLAQDLSLVAREVPEIAGPHVESADEIFLTNSVRGILPVAEVHDLRSGRDRAWPAPGRWTQLLQGELAARLIRRGDSR